MIGMMMRRSGDEEGVEGAWCVLLGGGFFFLKL